MYVFKDRGGCWVENGLECPRVDRGDELGSSAVENVKRESGTIWYVFWKLTRQDLVAAGSESVGEKRKSVSEASGFWLS